MNTRPVIAKVKTIVNDAPIMSLLVQNLSFAWIWLSLRVLFGLSLLDMASHRISQSHWQETQFALKRIAMSLNPNQSVTNLDAYRHAIQEFHNPRALYDLDKLIIPAEYVLGVCLVFGLFAGVFSLYGLLLSGKFIGLTLLSTDVYLLTVAFLLIVIWKLVTHLLVSLNTVAEKKKNSPQHLPRLTIG